MVCLMGGGFFVSNATHLFPRAERGRGGRGILKPSKRKVEKQRHFLDSYITKSQLSDIKKMHFAFLGVWHVGFRSACSPGSVGYALLDTRNLPEIPGEQPSRAHI